MSYSEDEILERVESNEEMARLLLSNKFIDVVDLNPCLKQLEKERLRGNMPPRLLRLIEEKSLLKPEFKKALSIAVERYEREKETSQFNIKGYKLTKKIGSGGLGVVYQGWQNTMRRKVAIKILFEKWVEDTEFKHRFLLEARVMGRLSHQNLIQVYDVGREGNHLYFAMEFIDGKTVEDLIKENDGLSLDFALDISLQIARAVHYISGYDIVHRDIKPANIMMTKNGIAKLGDFGFLYSKHEKNLAQEGYVIGTPDYISPEQASGKDVDFRSDIYSLGVCFYHMLTGDLPYHGTVSTVMRQHVSGDLPDRVVDKGKKIPPDVYNVVCKMMAKDPEDRYTDIRVLLDDLQYLKANETMKKGLSTREDEQVLNPGSMQLGKDSAVFSTPEQKLPDSSMDEIMQQQIDDLKEQNVKLFWMLVGSLTITVLMAMFLVLRR